MVTFTHNPQLFSPKSRVVTVTMTARCRYSRTPCTLKPMKHLNTLTTTRRDMTKLIYVVLFVFGTILGDFTVMSVAGYFMMC